MKPISQMTLAEKKEALKAARNVKPIAKMSLDEKKQMLKEARTKQLQRQQDEQEGEERRGQIGENIVRGAGEIVQDVPRAAAQAATLGFFDEISGAVQAPFSDRSYEEIRDEERKKYAQAQERSPITTLAAELIVPSPAKLIKAGGKAKSLLNTGEIATAAAGLSEGETTGEVLGEAALVTGGATLAGKTLGTAGKALFSEPEIMRAKRMGVRASDLPKETGTGFQVVEKLKETMKNLSNKNLFKFSDAVFDPKTNKFIRNPKKSKLDTTGTPSLPQIEVRIDDAIDKSSRYIEDKLASKSKSVKITGEFVEENQFPSRVDESGIYDKEFLKEYNDNELISMLNDDLVPTFGEEYQPQISKVFDESFINLDVDGSGFNIADLQAEKKRLYNTSYDRETPDVVRAAKRKLANMYKRMINDLSGDPKIAELNETMEQLFTVKDSLRRKIIGDAVEKESMQVVPYGSLPYQITTGVEALVDPTRMQRAAIGEKASELGQQYPQALELINQAGRRVIPFGASRSGNEGRMPQSIPEQLVRTPLPRDTAKLFEMKDVVLAKIAQMAPEMVDQIAEAMQTPATFQKILPLAVARFPNLFENDKYNRVDGKVLDPQSKQMANDDIMEDPNLSVYEKTQLISKMNKTGYLEY